jgi:hypothetical protein
MESPTTGHQFYQLVSARHNPLLLNLRNQYAADVIIFFTGKFEQISVCGHAVQYNWTGLGAHGFVDPDMDGLDLAGANNSYVAIVASNNPACTPIGETALHEFGHLFAASARLYLRVRSSRWST